MIQQRSNSLVRFSKATTISLEAISTHISEAQHHNFRCTNYLARRETLIVDVLNLFQLYLDLMPFEACRYVIKNERLLSRVANVVGGVNMA